MASEPEEEKYYWIADNGNAYTTAQRLDEELKKKGWPGVWGPSACRTPRYCFVFFCNPKEPDIVDDFWFTTESPLYWVSKVKKIKTANELYMSITEVFGIKNRYIVEGPHLEIPWKKDMNTEGIE